MDHLKTIPPLTEDQVVKIIGKFEALKQSNIDGKILAEMTRLCHDLGLKRSELRNLKIGDVSKSGIVFDEMKLGNCNIQLPVEVKEKIKSHLKYLKANSYKLYAKNPLFPGKDGKPYKDRNLTNHWNQLFYYHDESDEINLETIRQAGICHHYEKLCASGYSESECLTKTQEFARVDTMDYVKEILRQNKRPTGKKILYTDEEYKKLGLIDDPIPSPATPEPQRPNISLAELIKNTPPDDPFSTKSEYLDKETAEVAEKLSSEKPPDISPEKTTKELEEYYFGGKK